MDDLNAASGIQSIEYISKILELFCVGSGSLTLKEIAERLDESPAKVFRYLVSLSRIGLIHKNEHNEYEVGDLALDMSFKALNRLDPVDEACKTARQVNYTTGYGVALSVWGSMGPTVIKTYEPKQTLYSKIRVGSVMSLKATSIGQTFAKYLPDYILYETLEHEALRHSGTKLSLKERKEFIQMIKEEKQQRMTFMVDRPTPGLSSISIPVFSISEEIQFVLTVFHLTRVLNEQMVDIEHYLLDQIDELSKSIGVK